MVFGVWRVSGVDFWDGTVSYFPPLQMSTNSPPNGVDSVTNEKEFSFRAETSATGRAEVAFHISPIVEMKKVTETNRPLPLRTVSDLKRNLDSQLQGDPRATNVFTSIIKLDGRDALICAPRTNPNPGTPSVWFCSISFFWKQSAVWEESTVCSIVVSAEKQETFVALTNSLKSVKVKISNL